MDNDYSVLSVRIDDKYPEKDIMRAIQMIKGVDFVEGDVTVSDQWAADIDARCELANNVMAFLSRGRKNES